MLTSTDIDRLFKARKKLEAAHASMKEATLEIEEATAAILAESTADGVYVTQIWDDHRSANYVMTVSCGEVNLAKATDVR